MEERSIKFGQSLITIYWYLYVLPDKSMSILVSLVLH